MPSPPETASGPGVLGSPGALGAPGAVRPPRPRWLRGTIVEAAPLTERSRRLLLEVPEWPGSVPGQHVDVRLTAPDGYQATRSYSLAGSPAPEESGTRIELGVDRLPDGEVSPYLVDIAEVGDAVEVHGPLGGWFVWHPDDPRPVQLIAGGSGVVPFIAMLRAHATAPGEQPIRLLYSVRSADEAMYRSYLTESPHGSLVDWIYTRESPPGSLRKTGRLTAADVADLVIPREQEPQIFVCGSTGFAEQTSQLLIEQGYPAAAIKIERYGGSR